MQGGPGIGLACAHGPTAHQTDALDPELLGQQAVLCHDVVVGRDVRNRPLSRGGAVLLGEDDTAAPRWFGTPMKYRSGARARFGPVI